MNQYKKVAFFKCHFFCYKRLPIGGALQFPCVIAFFIIRLNIIVIIGF